MMTIGRRSRAFFCASCVVMVMATAANVTVETIMMLLMWVSASSVVPVQLLLQVRYFEGLQ